MKAGDLIQDRYLLEERLGKGGMGQVWRAVDQRLNRTVGIKVMAPEFTSEPEFLVRFLREAQSIARISHPNVVSVLDFGESDENPFLVMEYVPGKPLSEITGEPVEPDKAVAIVAQAADAAGAAHAQGIVHRDLKPANIVITDDDRVKLLDFGIASLENVDRITQTGTTIGSPHYISPEQATGDKATPRSDVYALGVVLFELLTGKKPFDGESVAAVAMAHVDEQPPAPVDLVPGLDPKLNAIVLKAMSKNPEDRFANGRELSEALGPGAAARTLVVPAAATVGSQTGASKTMVMAPSRDVFADEGDDDEDSPWRAALIGLLIGLVVLAIALVAYAMINDDSTSASDETPSDQDVNAPADTAPVVEEPTEEPVDDTTEVPESEPPTSPPASEPEEDGEEDEDTEETVEGDVGQGPDGEGPPGLEDKDKDKDKE